MDVGSCISDHANSLEIISLLLALDNLCISCGNDSDQEVKHDDLDE